MTTIGATGAYPMVSGFIRAMIPVAVVWLLMVVVYQGSKMLNTGKDKFIELFGTAY